MIVIPMSAAEKKKKEEEEGVKGEVCVRERRSGAGRGEVSKEMVVGGF